MLTRKQMIDKVAAKYTRSITGIAQDLGVSRHKVYSFIKGNSSEMGAALLVKYIDAFTAKEFDEITDMVNDNIEKVESKKKVAKKLVTSIKKVSVKKSSEKKVEDKNKIDKYIAPCKFLRSRNLMCKSECYPMKAPLKYLEMKRPSCPICGELMYTRKERKEKGWE